MILRTFKALGLIKYNRKILFNLSNSNKNDGFKKFKKLKDNKNSQQAQKDKINNANQEENKSTSKQQQKINKLILQQGNQKLKEQKQINENQSRNKNNSHQKKQKLQGRGFNKFIKNINKTQDNIEQSSQINQQSNNKTQLKEQKQINENQSRNKNNSHQKKQMLQGRGFNKFIKNINKTQKNIKTSRQINQQSNNKTQLKKQKQINENQSRNKNNSHQKKQMLQGLGFNKFIKNINKTQKNIKTSRQINQQSNNKTQLKKQKSKDEQLLDLTNEQNSSQKLKSQKNQNQATLNSKNQKQQQQNQKQKISIEDKQADFNQKMKNYKQNYRKQSSRPKINPNFWIFGQLLKIYKQIREKQPKKKDIPPFIKQNPNLLAIYQILMPMNLIIIIGILFGLFSLIKYSLKQQKYVLVQCKTLVDHLTKDEIKSTFLYKKNNNYDHQNQVNQKARLQVCVELKDGTKLYCISNEDFNNYWKKTVSNYNQQGIKFGKFIEIKKSIQDKQIKMLDLTRQMLSFILLFIFLRSMFRTGQRMGKGSSGLQIFQGNKSKRFRQIVNVKFNDVVGMQKAKQQIVQFIDFLVKPQKYNKLGAKIPRGALLTGPPGTGKTMIAKACAGQSNVPFFTISGSQFMEMYVGVGAQRVRDLFKEAKQAAPSIIFIDEIDAVGKKRASGFGGHDERDNTLNQLLVEMDGFSTNTNVIVFAATNQKDVLDPALTRPGRFDRLIEVDLPDLEGRKQIFLVHLRPIVLSQTNKVEEYARRMATLTPGFSGADIKNLCNQAAIIAARSNKIHVEMIDFQQATQRIIGGVQKKSSLITPQTRKIVAYHECGHGVASWFLQGANPLLKITIIPRSKGSLGFAQYLPNQNQISSRQQLQDQISVILGGRVCEQLFFNKISTGAYDDLQKAYKIAKMIVTQYGMTQNLGWLSFDQTEYAKEYSHKYQEKIDMEILSIIKACSNKTREILRSKQPLIQKLAEKLIEMQTIDQNVIQQILGPRPFKANKQYEQYLKEKKKLIGEANLSFNGPTFKIY